LAVGNRYYFQDIPNLSRNNIIVYGLEAFTESLLAVAHSVSTFVGASNGIVPMLRNFDMTARYVDQGGGKRKGSFSIYIEPWHADILDFLDLKKDTQLSPR
jgi:hypothetical protein